MKVVLLGAQWGDEGKGKITDAIADKLNPNAVIRYNGGANSGHTLIFDGQQVVSHNLPAGIARRGQLNIVGPYVLCDPEAIIKEMEYVHEHGSHVVIDRQCHVVLPIHKLFDGLKETLAGKNAIGTTKRGIGPTYQDFWGRYGIRMSDLVDQELIEHALGRSSYYEQKYQILAMHGIEAPTYEEAVKWCLECGDKLDLYLADTRKVVFERLQRSECMLFEGGQGVLLDTFHGSWPYVTSSMCTPAGISASFGLYGFEKVIGIVKAYCTRVGSGPFPTEQDNNDGQLLASIGHEVGATTGRPRRCGWLDLVLLKYAARVGNFSELVLTKLDVLSSFEKIPVAVRYVSDGRELPDVYTIAREILDDIEPVYEELDSWDEDITGCRSFEELPVEAQKYIQFIEEFVGLPVTGISNGPDRNQMIWR